MNKSSREDFQIKAYLLLYRELKKLQTFKIQKVVRKLKKEPIRQKELEDANGDQEAINKISTELERLGKQKAKLDLLKKDHLKMLAIHILTSGLGISLEKQKAYFEEELPDCWEKLEMFNQEDNDDIKLIKWFEESIRGHKVYKETQQKLELLVSKMEMVMDKNKARKKNRLQNKKERMKQAKDGVFDEEETKEELGENVNIDDGTAEDYDKDIVIGDYSNVLDTEDYGKDIVIEDDEEEEVRAPKKPYRNERRSGPNRQRDANKQTVVQNKGRDSRGDRKQGRDDYGQNRDRAQTNGRRDFQNRDSHNRGQSDVRARGKREFEEKGSFNRGQNDRDQQGFKERDSSFRNGQNDRRNNNRKDFSQNRGEEKIEKRVKKEDRSFSKTDAPGREGEWNNQQSEERENFKFDRLHPSWQARIEQKQKATISTFQGTKEKLC